MKQDSLKIMTTTHHPKPTNNTSSSSSSSSESSQSSSSKKTLASSIIQVLDAKEESSTTTMKIATTRTLTTVPSEDALVATEENGRERLKRHRGEVAGNVWIPDIWGQEELLKDWIDCSAFDASLVPSGIISARAALAKEGRRATSGGLIRIENRC